MTPRDLKYTKTHGWVRFDGDSATVGITDHAQNALGDITFVELPKPGALLTRGKECGVIESVKAASDLYAPVSGEVLETNSALQSEPESINRDPYGAGWLYRAKASPAGEEDDLMDAAGYESYLQSQE